jgi:hypothetical protein
VGGVLSTLTNVFTGELTFPATSVQVPEGAVCAAPSALTVTAAEQFAIPEVTSEPLKLTVTGTLFHPLALGVGVAAAVAIGGAVSRFTVTVCEVVPPALEALHVKD